MILKQKKENNKLITGINRQTATYCHFLSSKQHYKFFKKAISAPVLKLLTRLNKCKENKRQRLKVDANEVRILIVITLIENDNDYTGF
jgi:hypothetical protein